MLRSFWDHAPGYQRLAYVVGVALVAAGLVQAGIWALAGGSAAGPLSWRKPVTFGISFGLTTLTLGWVATYLPVRRRTAWVAACLLCASTTLEVAWVSLQPARGVPSHFNTATTLAKAGRCGSWLWRSSGTRACSASYWRAPSPALGRSTCAAAPWWASWSRWACWRFPLSPPSPAWVAAARRRRGGR